jgi:hypothetical protein
MPGTRQSTRFSASKKSDSEKTTGDIEATDKVDDVSVAAVDEGDGITVDLEVTDGTLSKGIAIIII